MCLKNKIELAEGQETEEGLDEDPNLRELTHMTVDANVEWRFLFIHCDKHVPTEYSNENWHRSSVFRIRVTCGGKLYNLIINGDSTENVVFIELVEKLGLNMK